jgi:hypothetical protein
MDQDEPNERIHDRSDSEDLSGFFIGENNKAISINSTSNNAKALC